MNNKTKNQKIFEIISISFITITLLIYYLPIFSVVLFSFNSSHSLTNFTGFSLQWYKQLFLDAELINTILMTFLVAVIATVSSTIIGTLAALAISRNINKKVRDMLLNMNNIPVVNPEVITAVGLFLFFIFLGIERGYLTLILSHIAFCTPYVIISVYPKIRNLDPNLPEAALDLGATPLQAITKVIIPQIQTAVLAGASMAFTMSFDDFVVSYFTAGANATNISIYLYNARQKIPMTINPLSTIILGVILVKIAYDAIKAKRKVVE